VTARATARLPLRADLEGRLLRRYKRFFADVALPDGRELTVHCPNPGSMLGCAEPGSAVRCSASDNPKRKLRHTLEMIRIGRTWVGLHTGLANAFVERVLAAGAIPELAGYPEIRREVKVDGGARLDFRLAGGRRKPAFVEVKSVTLAEGRVARFPDSVSERGRKHCATLARLRSEGHRAVQLYVVQRGDCRHVEPADDIDPRYGEALRDAARAGVEVLAVRAKVSPTGIAFDGPLPVKL
jgi:sugar fermentation stimulation protein A